MFKTSVSSLECCIMGSFFEVMESNRLVLFQEKKRPGSGFMETGFGADL